MRAIYLAMSMLWLLPPIQTRSWSAADLMSIVVGCVFGGIAWTRFRWDLKEVPPPRNWVLALKTAALVFAIVTTLEAFFCILFGVIELAQGDPDAMLLGGSIFSALNSFLLTMFVLRWPRPFVPRVAA